LVGNNATISFYLEERPGYIYKKHMMTNGATGTYDKNKKLFTINLTGSQDYDNPGILKIQYDKISNDFSITIKGYVTDKNGLNGSYFSTRKESAVEGELKKIEEPEGVNDNWTFVNATVDGVATSTSINPITKIRELKFTPTKDSDVIFNYKDKGVVGPKEIRVVALAVGLDENNEVIRENGRWEFARTDNIVTANVGGTVSITSPGKASKPPKYKDFKYAYTWDDTKLTGTWNSTTETMLDGKKYNGETVNIPVTSARDNYYVYFYYKKNVIPNPDPPGGGGGGGTIQFIPHQTNWTNQGKTSNGSGSYPVEVLFVGDNPVTGTGTYQYDEEKKGTDANGKPTTEKVTKNGTFPVTWDFERIDVSGSANRTINGTRGTVNISNEGYHHKLYGKGYYSQPKYTVPTGGYNVQLPPNPTNPSGESGFYDLDWTDPTTSFNVTPKIFNEANGATRGQSKKGIDQAYFGTLTSRDNLSGVASIEYGWTFGNNENQCRYELIYSNPGTTNLRSDEVITKEIEKPVGDNMYLHVRLRDVAGNETYQVFGEYEDPIMLKNFKVTDIRDRNWSMVFWKDWEKSLDRNNYLGDKPIFTEHTGFNYPINQLPIDNNSHPHFKDLWVKKGYAFYFDITSEYLYRDFDKIVINPKFYVIDTKTNKRQEVDIYYLEGENPFTQLKTPQDKTVVKMRMNGEEIKIGSCSQLELTKKVRKNKGRPFYSSEGGWQNEIQYVDGKEQYWYGNYYIPETSLISPKGVSPRPENLIEDKPLLIQFDIVAIKNGIETNSTSQTFSYVPNQWTKEGGPKDRAKYVEGDVLLYDWKYTVQDDFESSVTH
ncbi:MAG: hypothetical protein RR530_09875, partial [Clostridium sp.]